MCHRFRSVTIQNLIKVIPPPLVPYEPFHGRWEPIEAALGTPLPSDYKDFARLYGGGELFGYIYVQTPRTADGGGEFARWVGEVCRYWGHYESEASTVYWPTPGGLLPFANSLDGDYLFWVTDGQPEAWRIAIWHRDGFEDENVQTFDVGFTDFLAAVATGDLLLSVFPSDLLDGSEPFKPGWKA